MNYNQSSQKNTQKSAKELFAEDFLKRCGATRFVDFRGKDKIVKTEYEIMNQCKKPFKNKQK
jgi:hypothetical protein